MRILKILKKLTGVVMFSIAILVIWELPNQPMYTEIDMNINWIILLVVYFWICLSSLLIFED